MNAINPLQSSPSGSEQRSYEPSMEEILASIRRIISDDQSMPATNIPRDPAPPRAEIRTEPVLEPHKSDSTTLPPIASIPKEAARAMPTSRHDLPPAASDGKSASAMIPQGSVSAPQFPNPELPKPRSPISQTNAAAPVPSQRPSVVYSHSLDQPAPEPKPTGSAAPTAAPPPPASDDLDASDPYFDPPIEREEPASSSDLHAGLFSTQTHQSVSSAFNMLAATRLAANSDELLGMVREMMRPLLKTWLDDNLPSMVERMVRAEIERVARGR